MIEPYYEDSDVVAQPESACACGCGGLPRSGRRFITHHNRLENLQLCANVAEHMLIEGTYKRLLSQLMASGAVVYDREAKEYRLG